MRFPTGALRSATLTVGALALGICCAHAQSDPASRYPIDLPTALRLAGAQNLDIQVARERLRDAEAHRVSALERFFPWFGGGIAYHRRDGRAQAVPAGTISKTDYESYAPGATVTAQVPLGDAIYDSLAARQLAHAADQALQAQCLDATLGAAHGYFELAKAKALVAVAQQALDTSQTYQQQLHQAVALGIAFKGDELRVQTQTERYRIALRQAEAGQRIAAAELARVLHLDPIVELTPEDDGLVPLTLFATATAPEPMVQRALAARPEMKRSQALVSAAREAKNGAIYGPLIPTVGGQVFVGGIGGGHDDEPSTFGTAQDYTIGLSWRIGQGGLFDVGRIGSTRARLSAAHLGETRLRDTISAEVVAALTRVQSLSDQIELAKQNLRSASETLRLTRERKQYGVGIVLEDIQAQQALNQARHDYFTIIAEYNKAQYGLNRAVGGQVATEGPPIASAGASPPP